MVTLQEHLHFQTQIVLVIVSAHAEVVKAMFVVHGILGEIVLSLLNIKVFIVGRVISKVNSLVKLVLKNFLGNSKILGFGVIAKLKKRWNSNGVQLLFGSDLRLDQVDK